MNQQKRGSLVLIAVFFVCLLYVSVTTLYSFAFYLLGSGCLFFLYPSIHSFFVNRKQKNKEKEIKRLEKRLLDLHSEVV